MTQNGDDEGSVTFDPSNEAQAKAAIKECGCRQKRKVSEAERRRLTRQLEKARETAA